MATVKAQIIDALNREPLQNASITIVDRLGNNLHQGIIADLNGKFTLTSDLLTDNYLLVSYAGFEPLMVAVNTLNDRDYTPVELWVKGMNPVYVTPNSNKVGSWWLWLIIGGVVVIAAAKRKKKKKVAV